MTFTGLTYGVTYGFKVVAYNSVGMGDYSPFSNFIRPIRYPNAPTIGTVINSGTSAVVNWSAPTYIGGDTLLGYYVISEPATTTQNSSSTSITFTGLTIGTTYTYAVAAYNSAGVSSYSSYSSSVVACTVPQAPIIGTASMTSGDKTATVTWTAPSDNGGSSITGYSVISSPTTSTQLADSSASSLLFTGLSYGVTYTFTVAAVNTVGTGSYSNSSNSVYSTAVPTSPTSITATVDVDQTYATISWSAPTENGGETITEYVVVSSPETSTYTVTSDTTSVTATGLTYFTDYTFYVAAVNSVGTGTYGSSNTIAPYYYRITATKSQTITDIDSTISVFMGSITSEASVIDINIYDDKTKTGTSGFSYVDDPIYNDAFVLTASFNALDASGNILTDFTTAPVVTEIDIPHANTSSTLKLFKLNDSGTVLVPQPTGYPKTFTYNSATGLWRGSLTAFSDYAFVDIGQGTTSESTGGGDPHVRTIDGVYTLLPNSWKRVRMYEKGDTKVIAKCKFAPEWLLDNMHILCENGDVCTLTQNYRKQWLAENLTYMYELELYEKDRLCMRIDLFSGKVIHNNGVFEITTPKHPWGLYSITSKERYPPSSAYSSFDIAINDDGDYISVDVDPFWDDVNNVTFHSKSEAKKFGAEYRGEFFKHSVYNNLRH